MSKKKFIGVQFVETVRVGKRTFAFGIYGDHKVGRIPFVGLAEKNPEDKDKPIRGRNLAIARAFENLGKYMAKEEWKKIQPKKVFISTTVPWTKEQIEIAKATPEAQKKIAERAKKHAKENSKANKSTIETSIKVRKTRAPKTSS